MVRFPGLGQTPTGGERKSRLLGYYLTNSEPDDVSAEISNMADGDVTWAGPALELNTTWAGISHARKQKKSLKGRNEPERDRQCWTKTKQLAHRQDGHVTSASGSWPWAF